MVTEPKDRPPPGLSDDTPEHLAPTTEAQDAVFRVSVGWCGGQGEAVLGPDNHIAWFEKLPIFLDEASRKLIMDRIPPHDGAIGVPAIKVSARVSLKRKRARNASIPGRPKQTFYVLLISELYDACWIADTP